MGIDTGGFDGEIYYAVVMERTEDGATKVVANYNGRSKTDYLEFIKKWEESTIIIYEEK